MNEKLEKDIKDLKNFLEKFDSFPVMMHIANTFASTDMFSTGLMSPYKQSLYLGGLLLSTEQNDSLEFSEETVKIINNKLQDIVLDYSMTFFPTLEEYSAGLTDDWKRFREVSMPIFLDYFNTVSLTYQEQQIERINRWFMPFNQEFKQIAGISVKELLDIFSFIYAYIQENIKNEENQQEEAFKKMGDLLTKASTEKLSQEQVQIIAKEDGTQGAWLELHKSIDSVYKVPVNELEEKFGNDIAQTLIRNFALTRENREFCYYTEPNPFELFPIWIIDKETIFIPCIKQILNAFYDFLYRTIEKTAYKDRFYRNRDKQVEIQALEVFKNLFKNEASYYTSVFENDKSHNEHDIVVIYQRTLLIVEVKASKLKEPFRDPQKAYDRILRDFRSDHGIQKAYDQGQNLKSLISENTVTSLYDEKGNKILDINRDSINDIFIICLTAEHMGMLGLNLSLLLEKKDEEPFPWACDIYDLENIVDTFNYKKLGPKKFIEYLKGRQEIHAKVHSFDELEVCGYFINNKNFNKLISEKHDIFYFTPDWADVFDEVYFQKHGIEHPIFNNQVSPIVQHKEQNKKQSKRGKKKREKQNEKQKKKDRKKNRKRK